MKRIVWGLVATLSVLIGCQKPEPEAPPTPPKAANGGVTPMVPGAGVPNAPMNNTESVEGAGMGGVGQSAKDRARGIAASAGSPAGTAGNPEPDPNGQ